MEPAVTEREAPGERRGPLGVEIMKARPIAEAILLPGL